MMINQVYISKTSLQENFKHTSYTCPLFAEYPLFEKPNLGQQRQLKFQNNYCQLYLMLSPRSSTAFENILCSLKKISIPSTKYQTIIYLKV